MSRIVAMAEGSILRPGFQSQVFNRSAYLMQCGVGNVHGWGGGTDMLGAGVNKQCSVRDDGAITAR